MYVLTQALQNCSKLLVHASFMDEPVVVSTLQIAEARHPYFQPPKVATTIWLMY